MSKASPSAHKALEEMCRIMGGNPTDEDGDKLLSIFDRALKNERSASRGLMEELDRLTLQLNHNGMDRYRAQKAIDAYKKILGDQLNAS